MGSETEGEGREMMRLTVPMIHAALSATGFKIVDGETVDPIKRCGCPLGVYCWSKDDGDNLTFQKAVKLGFDLVYVGDFMMGFDDGKPKRHEKPSEGRLDGFAARREFLPLTGEQR